MELKFRPKEPSLKFEASVLVYYCIILILQQIPLYLELFIFEEKPAEQTNLSVDIFWPAMFVLFNIIVYKIAKFRLIFRGLIMILSGVIISIIKFYMSPGIIDPVYFFVLSASCAMTIGVYRGEYLYDQLNEVKSYKFTTDKSLDYLRDGFKYILGKVFQGWLALGASLGVSMSILFRSGFDDPHLKFVAVKMLIGFIGISFGVGYWLALPMLNGMIQVQEKLNELRTENSSDE